MWPELDDDLLNETDWFWILYPSHVPEFPDFDDNAFITGGMGSDSKGGPLFIIDDKWLVRKPAHLGDGMYNDVERRIYLPQWLQHEFYHHLYRIYPEFSLEVNGHDSNVVQTLTGFGECGAALVNCDAVDKIIFTGSPGVGKLVMEGCSKSLKPCILELGGKDPMVFCDDVKIEVRS